MTKIGFPDPDRAFPDPMILMKEETEILNSKYGIE